MQVRGYTKVRYVHSFDTAVAEEKEQERGGRILHAEVPSWAYSCKDASSHGRGEEREHGKIQPDRHWSIFETLFSNLWTHTERAFVDTLRSKYFAKSVERYLVPILDLSKVGRIK